MRQLSKVTSAYRVRQFTQETRMLLMATRRIKDPTVRELAMQLAARRGTSATGAIRQALIETLGRSTRTRAGLAERLLTLGRESAALPEPVLTDDDLYDEHGLPR